MDIIFLLILVVIGVTGLVKGQIKISKNKALKGTKARVLSLIFILAGVQLVVKDYLVRNTPGASDAAMGYLLGTAAVVLVLAVLFMIFGQEDIKS